MMDCIQGQTFMVIGAAGELPKPPSTPIQFLEGECAFCVVSLPRCRGSSHNQS